MLLRIENPVQSGIDGSPFCSMIEIDLQPDADVVIIRLRGIQSRGEFEDLASALDSPRRPGPMRVLFDGSELKGGDFSDGVAIYARVGEDGAIDRLGCNYSSPSLEQAGSVDCGGVANPERTGALTAL
jgi:hypothetical protein